MTKRTYPDLICWDCIKLTGKDLSKFHNRDITQSEGTCGVCKRKAVVVPPRDVGHFSQEQIAKARAEVKRLGIRGNDVLDAKAVEKALTIVDGVLGEDMSLWTRKVYEGIKDEFERGKKITKYDLEKLMFWFARDVEMRGNKDGNSGGGTEESLLTDGNGQPLRRADSPVDDEKRIILAGG